LQDRETLEAVIEEELLGSKTPLLQMGLLKVYSPAKTVPDCFKFRCQIGVHVAEAPRDC
jgi:hypothetical protein